MFGQNGEIDYEKKQNGLRLYHHFFQPSRDHLEVLEKRLLKVHMMVMVISVCTILFLLQICF
jgi:hypothetical protein